ncbi:protein FAR1-RELATED SEQUENCE 11 [Cannabis sativa]|uniref:protein FAR1-RELATED SEQUENCE 11 n=1 Tax=Cannabis sativa TaxID=3483 RepID=UPI0029CA85E1|nr:protein FAR1-RELATED SEQUENCE 11 [Cannabis sativa]XP_030507734.2 protein FAR1-RELATED SEQUENCE 11 [Cannabis sativa]XP_030507735.2 protein FAR1-RELATED SEQUENCE 11 [Cannabis sativa]XP_060960582.1 protein FAR1-RELATED SEQUENCE 11 [Cannabis sativa]XP_060960583.1 protein FAR1-RELATED SEQUENCE 11 [Cannabis sativa]XP_060960584.1 protein FAR1-RELATED SEQUENCE 11 [Cannabis sativa]XP_060960585.1 protein FAR1-RELATED SEQUENCE 11 [Cannabis sativa]XP_060960586.1 protein FAR1-RELATED SEQUENCE 11 [Cann
MSEGTSLVIESSENCTDLSQDDVSTTGETSDDTILSRQTSVNLVPFIGQRFVSQEAAYEFYCSFGKQCGFSIRRHRTRGKDGVGRGITRRDFTCHRAGYPQMKPSEDGKLQRNRKSSRCGCQAYMRIVKRAEFDHVPEWRVTGFSNNHNHELLKSNEVCVIPTYCIISPDDKSRICLFAKAGMSVRQMLRLMELEKGVKLGCLPFTEIDVRNLLQSFRNVDRDNDAIDLISMCKKLKDENPNFKYDFKIDGHNRLDHIAWSYASSVQSYEAFGDAVVFDTTHRLDAYDMLLGIWLGIDNYGTTCFFGCVLLRDENMQSFSWALKTFLDFMKGKAPQTLLTDHNTWLKESIVNEMPQTKHAFCIWHIISKFSNWFSVLLGSRYDEWKIEFHHLYNLDGADDFEEGWRDMVNKYGLQTNRHIMSLYALRTFWALAFLRHFFFAGMMNTSQAESINAFIQRFLSAQSQMDRFVHNLADVVEFKDRAGAKQKMQQKMQKVCLKTGSPIEAHAASVLTPYAFNKLQEELVLAPQYASVPVDDGCFQVRHHTQMDGGCKVIWLPCQELISCSCHQFEFSGILCKHVLRVLSTNNCFHIPDEYLPTRWRDASSSTTYTFQNTSMREHSGKVQLLESMASALIAESVETDERLDSACEQIAIVLSRIKDLPRPMHDTNDDYTCPSDALILQEVEDADGIVRFTVGNPHESISTGKLKERRPRDGVDIGRKRRSGSCCGQFGHDASECQLMGGDHLNGDALGYL